MAAKRKWSQAVTEHSNAMDVAGGTFTEHDPKKIARDLEGDAKASRRRKSPPERSALQMITFYINRAGKNLSAAQRKVLDEAKAILREHAQAESAAAKGAVRTKAAPQKTAARSRVGKKKSTAKKTAGRTRKKSPRQAKTTR